METKAAAGQMVYEDVVPSYKFVREEGIDTLVIELSEFKKEQIRVELDKFGKLSISGERPLAHNKRSRFRSAFEVPEDCNEIRAKFENGRLYVKVLPKFITETSMEAATTIKETRVKDQKPSIGKVDMNQKAISRPSVGPNGVPKKKEDEKRDAEKVGEKEKDQIEEKKDKKQLEVLESSLAFSEPMQIPVNLIVVVLVLLVIALYVTFKH
ncbi:uncharacterized protein [Elaeis guineensis]|uniref:Inactive protein RESTRICTED TEV MOVEMENT 2-like n=1 Tax=Elaeis guineensis var. tenera TaxID=51953 RepID=A0A6I9QZZ5_ELAGV|nr:inactive protein RESTRICTED TEV MOVEMENT 2-like [Elaeis guineensis]